MDLINRLEELITILGISKREFAKQIGRSPSGVGDFFSGRSKPSDPTIKSICKTFNISEEWLINGTGSMYNDHNTITKCELTQEEFEVIRLYRNLTEKDKGYVTGILEAKIRK